MDDRVTGEEQVADRRAFLKRMFGVATVGVGAVALAGCVGWDDYGHGRGRRGGRAGRDRRDRDGDGRRGDRGRGRRGD